MNPIEIVKRIRSTNPKLLDNIADAKVANIIRATLNHIHKDIEETEEGVVVVQGLGRFRIKQIERQKDDTTVIVKRVLFKGKPPKEAAKE
jgi:nucleoid DNA-binding protein